MNSIDQKKPREEDDMKAGLRKFLLLLALAPALPANSQTVEQSLNAYDRGDFNTAVKGFKNHAEKGDIQSQVMLGAMYGDQTSALRNYQLSVFWYRRAAENGNLIAQYSLGWAYEYGRGIEKDLIQAFTWYRRSASQGYARAQFAVGKGYLEGRGASKDIQQAILWFRKAAEQDYDPAQYALSTIIERENIVEDLWQAPIWLKKAAESGNPRAQLDLGLSYMEGHRVEKNESLGVQWLEKSASGGNQAAQYNLGYFYFNGKGVPKDSRVAFQWYKKAAESGFLPAQFEVGAFYGTGNGVAKDEREAARWYRVAADRGFAPAQNNLAAVYADGRGVPRDDQMAYFWLLLASAQGEERGAGDARTALGSVEARLTNEQRAAAQSEARNWRPKAESDGNGQANIGANGDRKAPASVESSAGHSSRPDATGSGFRVGRGSIVTNYHVIDGCRRLQVNGVQAFVNGRDARSDLALLSANIAGANVGLRSQRVAVGEPVAVAGYPLRGILSGFNMTTGNVSSLSGLGGDTRLLQISAPVQPGNSGGPALDSSGNLVGVVVSKLDALKAAQLTGDIPQNVNFAINANVVRSFLDANGVGYETISSDKGISTTAIAERAKSFTVLIECWN